MKKFDGNFCMSPGACLQSLLLMYSFVHAAAAEKVTPIDLCIVIIGDNPLFGYTATAPAFDVALDKAKELYPRVFQDSHSRTHYQPSNSENCQDSAGDMLVLVTSLYNSTHPQYETANSRKLFCISPGCSTEIQQFGDISRELDFPLLATTAADHSLTDDERYPTLLAAGSSAQYSVSQITLALLRKHLWTSISIIFDKVSGELAFAPLVQLYATTFLNTVGAPSSGVNTLLFEIDSTVSTDYAATLKMAAAHSSVIFLFSPKVEAYASILRLAVRFHMDSGRFVFFVLRLPELPFFNGPVSVRDAILKNGTASILPCVFLLTSPPRALTKNLGNQWDKIADRSRDFYNRTIPPEFKFNALSLSAYDSVLMLAEVINDAYDKIDNMTGQEFTRLFLGRSFNRSISSPLQMTGKRNRNISTVAMLYNETAGDFQAVWSKFAEGPLYFVGPENWKIQWKGDFPPKSDPFCNMIDQDVDCALTDPLGYAYLLLLLIPIILGAALKIRKSLIGKNNEWWVVRHNEIDYDTLVKAGYPPFRLAIRGLAVNQISLDGREMVYRHGLYRGEVVQVLAFAFGGTFADMVKKPKYLNMLRQVRTLDHPNVARLIGIGFAPATAVTPHQMLVVTECPKKGFLRDLIDNDSLVFTWDFRASLIWDILRGLRYIHGSPIRFHGSVCFLNLIIDEHFTLKLARAGGIQLYEAMNGSGPDGRFRFPIPRIANLWMAPETVDQETLDGQISVTRPGPPADIFSLGVILYEVASRNAPFEVDITDIVAIKAKICEIRRGQLDVDDYPMPEHTPPEIVRLIKRCWSFNPANRPTIGQISSTLNHLHPGTNISVAEGILRRLEHYNTELEATVAARKDALHVEMAKVDALLSNVLPKSIVQELRNGQAAIPDYFSAVTVLFSDIPAFNDMVAKCMPFAIVDLLHRLYSKMDEVIERHDVYKVETIKDSYMVASGLPIRNDDRHAEEIAKVALLFLTASTEVHSPTEYQHHCTTVRLRIGMNSGPCVAAVIGQKQPRYCLVGDTVNTASRMETNGEELKIHITESTKRLLDPTNMFLIEARGLITIKGKGNMSTYWLTGVRHSYP